MSERRRAGAKKWFETTTPEQRQAQSRAANAVRWANRPASVIEPGSRQTEAVPKRQRTMSLIAVKRAAARKRRDNVLKRQAAAQSSPIS